MKIQEETIDNYVQIDSLRVVKINNCEKKVEEYAIQNNNLKTQLNKVKKNFNLCKWVAGGGIVTAILLLCLQ